MNELLKMVWWDKSYSETGTQVILSSYNVEKFIDECLLSIELSMKGLKWILCIADDGSVDETWNKIKNYKSLTADKTIIKRFPKADNVSVAKNRALSLGREYRNEYQCIALMDADDTMTEHRVKYLLPYAIENNYPVVCGDHKRVSRDYQDEDQRIYKVRDHASYLLPFGPWALVFTSKLIPENGKLFREDMECLEDSDLFMRWLCEGILIKPKSGKVVHIYRRRKGSVFDFTNVDNNINDARYQKWTDHRAEYFKGRNIDIGVDRKYTIGMLFEDHTDTKRSAGNVLKNLSHIMMQPDLRFILIDLTKDKVVENLIAYPLAKELACGYMNYERLETFDEKERLRLTKKYGSISFISAEMLLNRFLINRINEVHSHNK